MTSVQLAFVLAALVSAVINPWSCLAAIVLGLAVVCIFIVKS